MKHIRIILCILCFLFLSSFTFRNQRTSYVMIENTSKRILEGSNYNDISLVASTGKILTAIVSIEYYDVNEVITVTKEDTLAVGSKVYLFEGEQITRLSLIYGLMLQSGNDAASALSKQNSFEFIYRMNEVAKKIGMINSSFSNASGLDEKDYNLSTAYDMALLMSYAMNNPLFRKITSTKSYRLKRNNLFYVWNNKHKLVNNCEGFIGGKTGYTKKSGRILVSTYRKDGIEVSIVTINYGNDWNQHKGLAGTLKNYKFHKILNKGIYNSYLLDIDYYILIEHDYYIPLKNYEVKDISIKYILKQNSAIIQVFIGDSCIIEDKAPIFKKNNFDINQILDYLI